MTGSQFAAIVAASCCILTPASAARSQPGTVIQPQDIYSACAPNADEPHLSLHVEVRDEYGLWRAGESVEVSAMDGLPIAAIHCEGPWANFVVPPGRYSVRAFLGPERSQPVEVDVQPSGSTVTVMLERAPHPPADEIVG